MRIKRSVAISTLAAASLGCVARPGWAAAEAPATVTIAYQPGLGYANLIVIKAQGTLEKQFPQTKIQWVQLSNGAAIRDGMIANQIQIGSGGIGAFLVGWDRGVGYRLIASLNTMDTWLVAHDPAIRTLRDIKPDMKIGMPGPDSPQAVVLRQAATQQLGNAHALDTNIVAIAHPLGLVALQNGQLAAHLTSPPFQYEEVAAGGHVVLRAYDVLGPATFNSAYTTQQFYEQYPKFVNTFYRDLLDAAVYIKANPKATAAMLVAESGGKGSVTEYVGWIVRPDNAFGTTPHGYLKYARAMQAQGLISKVPVSMHEIELPNLGGVGD